MSVTKSDLGDKEEPYTREDGLVDNFVAFYRRLRRPVTPAELAVYTGESESFIAEVMRWMEEVGTVVWEENGWRPK